MKYAENLRFILHGNGTFINIPRNIKQKVDKTILFVLCKINSKKKKKIN